jgi:predicted transglutaminase-like cysteine proteinase
MLLLSLALPQTAAADVLAASPSRQLLQALQNFAQKHHQYRSDQQQYRQTDYWQASLEGDCEDYALWLQQKLLLLAVPSELVWVWRQGQSHMVLLVADQYVMDNLQPQVQLLADAKAQRAYQRVFGKWQLRHGQQVFVAQSEL